MGCHVSRQGRMGTLAQAWLTCGGAVGSGVRAGCGGAEASGLAEVGCEGG